MPSVWLRALWLEKETRFFYGAQMRALAHNSKHNFVCTTYSTIGGLSLVFSAQSELLTEWLPWWVRTGILAVGVLWPTWHWAQSTRTICHQKAVEKTWLTFVINAVEQRLAQANSPIHINEALRVQRWAQRRYQRLWDREIQAITRTLQNLDCSKYSNFPRRSCSFPESRSATDNYHSGIRAQQHANTARCHLIHHCNF